MPIRARTIDFDFADAACTTVHEWYSLWSSGELNPQSVIWFTDGVFERAELPFEGKEWTLSVSVPNVSMKLIVPREELVRKLSMLKVTRDRDTEFLKYLEDLGLPRIPFDGDVHVHPVTAKLNMNGHYEDTELHAVVEMTFPSFVEQYRSGELWDWAEFEGRAPQGAVVSQVASKCSSITIMGDHWGPTDEIRLLDEKPPSGFTARSKDLIGTPARDFRRT